VYVDPSLLSVPANQQPTTAGAGIALPTYVTIGTAYTFANAGDVVDWHSHVQGSGHLTVVASGTLRYDQSTDGTTANFTSQTLVAPAIVAVPEGVQHRFVASGGPAACFNLMYTLFDAASMKTQITGLLNDVQTQVTAIKAANV
jgi:quercetin dioxygenase-like cupin family protein